MSAANKNFFVAHYDRLALVVGALALLGGLAFYLLAGGESPDAAAAAATASVARMKPSETGVASVEMTALAAATRLVNSPASVGEPSEKGASFLASERRVRCTKCKKVIIGDVKACPSCPYCGEKQAEEKKVVLDTDGDGLPDEWERRYGLNPGDAADASADSDEDGFTNAEEFAAGTDPKDRRDHPDYLDSLAIVLPLKETRLPFIFTKATKIPAGWRCEFFNPDLKDDFGRRGLALTALLGAEIGKDEKKPSGYRLKTFEKKETKRARKGMKGLLVGVDVSEATVERLSDKKTATLVLAQTKKERPQAMDVMASLVYTRNGAKNFDVVPGTEIDLSGEKYKILDIQRDGKGAKVEISCVRTGRKKVLTALEESAQK